MMLRRSTPVLFVAFLAACALSGCSNEKNLGDRDDENESLDPDGIDLDEKNGIWMAEGNGKVLILLTYKNDASINLEVRETPKGSTAEQYTGARHNTYVFDFTCANALSMCQTFGKEDFLSCSAAGTKANPQLVCNGGRIFRPVTADDIAQ